jgi:hypothetical protein
MKSPLHRKKKDKKLVDLINEMNVEAVGEPIRVDISQLPFNEQEHIRRVMDMMGETDPPEIYQLNVKIGFEYLEFFPIEILADLMVDALKEDRYEDVEEISKVIKEKNWLIEITDKKLILTYNKEGVK